MNFFRALLAWIKPGPKRVPPCKMQRAINDFQAQHGIKEDELPEMMRDGIDPNDGERNDERNDK